MNKRIHIVENKNGTRIWWPRNFSLVSFGAEFVKTGQALEVGQRMKEMGVRRNTSSKFRLPSAM